MSRPPTSTRSSGNRSRRLGRCSASLPEQPCSTHRTPCRRRCSPQRTPPRCLGQTNRRPHAADHASAPITFDSCAPSSRSAESGPCRGDSREVDREGPCAGCVGLSLATTHQEAQVVAHVCPRQPGRPRSLRSRAGDPLDQYPIARPAQHRRRHDLHPVTRARPGAPAPGRTRWRARAVRAPTAATLRYAEPDIAPRPQSSNKCTNRLEVRQDRALR